MLDSKTRLQTNNTDLQGLIDKANNLPDAGSTEDLSAELAAQDALILQIEEALAGKAGGASLPAIYVTYPEGSTCTCTNGIDNYTAGDTSGVWLFGGLEIGDWTVTASNGINSKTSTVALISESQFETVELSYSLGIYIVADGVLQKEMSTKNAAYEASQASGGTTVSVTQKDGYVLVKGAGQGYGAAYTTFELENQRSIIVTLEGSFTVQTGDSARFYNLAIWSEFGTYLSDNMVALANYSESGTTLETTLPAGTYYVGITTVYTREQQITTLKID